MRRIGLLPATLIWLAFASGANAQFAANTHFSVKTTAGDIPVDGFEDAADDARPAVLVLSGSKGFGAPAYDDIGKTFQAAGFDVYLVHVLSPEDLSVINGTSGAKARITYYAKRFPAWTSAVQGVVSYFDAHRHRAGRLGLLGISLGAEIAALASIDNQDVSALVLVDGGLPDSFRGPIRVLPPLQVIWGSDDHVFPVSVAQRLSEKARQMGGSARLDIYNNGEHDFFLKPDLPQARSAYTSATMFLLSRLSRKP